MSSFVIEGGHKLSGEVIPQGAKNEALQILSSVLLTPGEVEIDNLPDIVDVNKLIDLLRSMGVKIRKLSEGKFWFKADEINLDFLKSEEFKTKGSSLRGSVMILGPLLTRFGIGALPRPGGDKIGRRRMDTTFLGFKELGAEFSYDAATTIMCSFSLAVQRIGDATNNYDAVNVTLAIFQGEVLERLVEHNNVYTAKVRSYAKDDSKTHC
jgi:UDP-N-acetylglucosamine enolpyruvyl transferase